MERAEVGFQWHIRWPLGDRMQGSLALLPPLLRPFPFIRGIRGGLCDATGIQALSRDLNWEGRKHLPFMIICLLIP